MKRCMLILAACAAALAARAEFLSRLPAEKYAAAGLHKLTPAELAQLEQLIAEHGQDKAVPAAELAPGPRPGGPVWLRALVTLQETTERPDAAEAVESRLAGDYDGWTGRTNFKLENGQIWQQVDGKSRYDDRRPSPKVKVYPGMLGSYWLEVEGVRERVKVKPVKLR